MAIDFIIAYAPWVLHFALRKGCQVNVQTQVRNPTSILVIHQDMEAFEGTLYNLLAMTGPTLTPHSVVHQTLSGSASPTSVHSPYSYPLINVACVLKHTSAHSALVSLIAAHTTSLDVQFTMCIVQMYALLRHTCGFMGTGLGLHLWSSGWGRSSRVVTWCCTRPGIGLAPRAR